MTVTASDTSTISLRALQGEPLADREVRRTVLATARAIAERIGVEMVDLDATDESIIATLRASRIEAIGFAAELRRLTNTWYAKKYDQPTLWGEPLHDERESWESE